MNNIYVPASALLEAAQKKLINLDSQQNAQKAIAGLVSMHTRYLAALDNGIEPDFLPSNSMLVIGKTGCGKSYILKTIAEEAGLEFAVIDASSLTAAGFKGVNLSESLRIAKHNCRHPAKFEEGAVVVFDEFDKIRFTEPEYNTSNPQYNFLKMLENGYVQVDDKMDLLESKKVIDTSRILFVFAGAFEGIEEQVKARHSMKPKIGFSSASSNDEIKDVLSLVTLEDINKYGFLNELLGRIGEVLYIPPLDVDDYKKLIKGYEASFENKYRNLFAVQGVDFFITQEGCELIAEKAMEQNIGSRSISAILQNCLNKSFQYIDDNEDVGKVFLSTENGEFKIEYKKGKRNILAKEDEVEKRLHLDVTEYIKEEKDINIFCSHLISLINIEDKQEESAVFNYLQTVLRCLRLVQEKKYKRVINVLHLSSVGKSLVQGGSEKIKLDDFISCEIKERIKDEKTDCTTKGELLTVQNFYNSYKTLETPDIMKNLESRLTEIFKRFDEEKYVERIGAPIITEDNNDIK